MDGNKSIAHTNNVDKFSRQIEMQLSHLEHSMVMAMRDCLDERVSVLKDMLCESEMKRYDLETWIKDLITALDVHDIAIPPHPDSLFPGTPSSCELN
jgi:hypothetical protein